MTGYMRDMFWDLYIRDLDLSADISHVGCREYWIAVPGACCMGPKQGSTSSSVSQECAGFEQ